MELKYISTVKLFGDPPSDERISELASALSELGAISRRVGEILQIKNDRKRAESLAGLYLLSQMADLSGGEYISGSGKKPYLSRGPEFNISHSGGVVVCAVDDRPVGIDVEEIRAVRDRDGLASRYFCSEEIEKMKASADPKLEFLRIWTKKEACLKLTGEGLTRDLCEINVFACPARFYEQTVEGRYIVTVCQN